MKLMDKDQERTDCLVNIRKQILRQKSLKNVYQSIAKESDEDFADMVDIPSSGWEGGYETIEDGNKYWIKTRNDELIAIPWIE